MFLNVLNLFFLCFLKVVECGLRVGLEGGRVDRVEVEARGR